MANTENAGSTADVPPVRYRVSGMDCAKDAAQIERAAQAAGVAPGDVKVSAATHIMTLTAPEVRLPDIEKAVAVTGYGFDRIEGDEDIPPNPAHQDPAYRRALWIVVILNVGYGVLEMIGGFISGSQAVKADALDFIGDGAITFLGLLAIGWSLAWRARSALIQGIFLGLLGLGVLGTTIVLAGTAWFRSDSWPLLSSPARQGVNDTAPFASTGRTSPPCPRTTWWQRDARSASSSSPHRCCAAGPSPRTSGCPWNTWARPQRRSIGG